MKPSCEKPLIYRDSRTLKVDADGLGTKLKLLGFQKVTMGVLPQPRQYT
jgi:hypothetical protein